MAVEVEYTFKVREDFDLTQCMVDLDQTQIHDYTIIGYDARQHKVTVTYMGALGPYECDILNTVMQKYAPRSLPKNKEQYFSPFTGKWQ